MKIFLFPLAIEIRKPEGFLNFHISPLSLIYLNCSNGRFLTRRINDSRKCNAVVLYYSIVLRLPRERLCFVPLRLTRVILDGEYCWRTYGTDSKNRLVPPVVLFFFIIHKFTKCLSHKTSNKIV